MELSDQQYYRALRARDPRFDGKFYICVSTTGIYCRPICPAVHPKPENCSYVHSAAAAEDLGFRPCLRCRPETAPGSPPWLGTGATVKRALRLISETAAEGHSIENLANRLGVSTRHLSRLFGEQVGAGPKSVAHTERLAIARQLLSRTNLPMAEVALASGFCSIRRFNDASIKAFGCTPTEYRNLRHSKRSTRDNCNQPRLRLRLGYRPPLAWDEMLGFFRARAIPGVEDISADTYRRTIDIDHSAGTLTASPAIGRCAIIAEFSLERPVALGGAIRQVRDLFDLDASPEDVAAHLSADPMISPLIATSPGLRIPGCWGVFELCVRAIVGQQISVKGATTMLGRLAHQFGRGLDDGSNSDTLKLLFPRPLDLCGQDLTSIGLTRARGATLVSLADRFAQDKAFIHPALESGEARRRLLEIRGIGPWTADYIALRALRNPDALPAADIALMKAAGVSKPKALETLAENWRPWRGYAALCLWLSLTQEKLP